MSSSVFIESSSLPKTATESLDGQHVLGGGVTGSIGTADSNLVVVYGKNGINFDRKGLENLIEEKTLSSISVIRLTSPTPSMKDEEEESERQRELLRKQGIGSDEEGFDRNEDLTTDDEKNSDESEEPFETHADEYESSTNEDESSAAEKEKPKRGRKKKIVAKPRNTQHRADKNKRKRNKDRPEIVGLTVEEFYAPEDAREMAKEILKLAGVSTIRRTADFEFQLYVIKNDHCYTPFTSPAQMKAKLAAEKLDTEKSLPVVRKLVTQSNASVKQFVTKKKQQQLGDPTKTAFSKKVLSDREKTDAKQRIDERGKQKDKYKKFTADGGEFVEDDDDIASSQSEEEFEESDFTTSDVSAESANDRDSDLDFDVNNRKGRKRKVRNNKINKRRGAGKRNQRQSQDDSETTKSFTTVMKSNRRLSNENVRFGGKNVGTPIKVNSGTASNKSHPQIERTMSNVGKKSLALPEKTMSPSTHQTTIAAAVRRGPIVQVGASPSRNLNSGNLGKVPSSPQTVKEIAINKVIASPKGGFTNIGALLSQPDMEAVSAPTTPTSSLRPPPPQKTTPSSKGFMPLGIEAAVKNQLPSQISIQTHQSSSELAAEHDKQLDLIDSIVKDEMKKSSIIEKAPGENDNIPQIVKMLESTEMALESNKSQQMSTYTSTSAVEDIDIANAPLLETPEDEIPDELLQHVVELMKDDKTLQAAVEKEVFGDDNNISDKSVTPTTHLTSLLQQSEKSKSPILSEMEELINVCESPQNKSIIQTTLSNNLAFSSNSSSPIPGMCRTLNTSRSTPIVRKEPIQIVRGNGRVITLPPIEAPTTRAKRRAQTQPVHSLNTSASDSLQSVLNESLDTSLQSNASFSTDSVLVNIPVVEKKATEGTTATTTTRRRISKEGNASTTSSKATKKVVKKAAAKTTPKNDAEDEESQEDDDDPNKLWCICRQPHNNRFMICCDVCEDWFHGTCVSITKAMGLEMEQKGIDWTCPKCVKKNEEKKQRKITDMLEPKKHEMSPNVPVCTQSSNDATTEQDVSFNMQSNELTLATSTPKQELMPKKELIEIKKIQSGQFISLKDLEQRKQPLVVLTSGQKKQLSTPTTQPQKLIGTLQGQGQAKRVIVVQKLPGNKSTLPTKTVTVAKSPHQMQIKLQKVPTAKSTSSPNTSGMTTTVHKSSSETMAENVNSKTTCIVCRKPARPNSIYCSDDCIRKHAQNALNVFSAKSPEPSALSPHVKVGTEDKKKKAKGLFEDLLSMADRKPKAERVYVYERKSGRVLTGSNAPTTANLKKWLQDNPTFEVVQPGSVQALEIEKKQKQRSTLISKITTGPATPNAHDTPTTPTKRTPPISTEKVDEPSIEPVPQSRVVKQLIDQSKTSPSVSRPGTPKQLLKYPQQVSIKPDKPQKQEPKDDSKSKDKNVKRQISDTNSKKPVGASGSETPSSSTDSEPIRLNVRRTLKEQLLQRINELVINNPAEGDIKKKLSSEEVEEFVKETESEMYDYFNRDTGAKYKAKYRSLMFNIKDRKNQTLFQKICAKEINPKQLVRMSPEELASQELAQWRENEAKHQLEMIKKSELDLLSCAKNYVLKTHKGEEVIEGKSDCVNLDITIPVEDVVSVLNNSVTSTDGLEETTVRKHHSISEWDSSKDMESFTTASTEEKNKSVVKEKERDRDRNRERDHDKKHKSKDREKSKTRKRSRSRSRSHSREKRHKSSHKEDKREKEERDRERERGRERDRIKDDHDKKLVHKKSAHSAVQSPVTVKSVSTAKEKQKDPAHGKKETVKPLEAFSLIDQILESTKTVEEAANLVTEKNTEKIKPTATTTHSTNHPNTASSVQSSVQNSDSDQEPTSTVSINSSPQDPYMAYSRDESSASLWSGNINMIDVASFQVLVQSVVGNCVNLGKLLPPELDVVGRIGPDTVWDYISKTKKSPNKEIVIVRLLPAYESETNAYTILYQYLYKRNRLGVIKTTSSQIKDFYIFPLVAGNQMPAVLQPTEPVEFYEDPYRPDILVGILIRVIGKRTSMVIPPPIKGKLPKFSSVKKDADSFTPPGSPKRKRMFSAAPKDDDIDIDAIIKAPIVAKKNIAPVVPTSTTVDDQDEPYSPGGSSDDDLPLVPVKPSEFHKTAEEELKRKMEELNRQIAAQEMEIAGLLNVEPSKYISSSSTTAPVINPSLASISIPSNLSQILASIKGKPDSPSHQMQSPSAAPPPPLIGSLIKTSDDDDEYNPEDEINISYADNVQNVEKSSTSRLAQLSEAELLSMVPDDMLDNTSSSSLPPVGKKSRYDEPPPPGV